MKNFNELPADVQKDIKQTLKAYSEVFVVFEYGEYHVGVGVSLKAVYAPDHEVIGTFYAKDLYTPEERDINYIEEFHDYPAGYKGKRDYRLLRELKGQWDVKFKYDEEGNLVVA